MTALELYGRRTLTVADELDDLREQLVASEDELRNVTRSLERDPFSRDLLEAREWARREIAEFRELIADLDGRDPSEPL